jgi:hypothetical protein
LAASSALSGNSPVTVTSGLDPSTRNLNRPFRRQVLVAIPDRTQLDSAEPSCGNPQLQPVCAPMKRTVGNENHWRTASRAVSTSLTPSRDRPGVAGYRWSRGSASSTWLTGRFRVDGDAGMISSGRRRHLEVSADLPREIVVLRAFRLT